MAPTGAAPLPRVPVASAKSPASRRRRWYVAQTIPRKERWAIQHLNFQGFETFFPRFHQRVLRRTGPQTCLTPVFPGYVFVSFDEDAQYWPSIRGTRGVRRLVGPGRGRPQPVPEEAMQCLLTRCREEVMTNLLEELRPGDLVQINTGPLFRRIAQVQSLPEGGRVRLLFDLLGVTNSIEVDVSSLSPVT